jgi:hypothetical protein
VFEGLIISDTYGALGAMLEDFSKDVIMAFLDTPVQVGLDRVRSRQAKSGRARGEKNVEAHYARSRNVRKRMESEGKFRLESISSENGAQKVLGWLT